MRFSSTASLAEKFAVANKLRLRWNLVLRIYT